MVYEWFGYLLLGTFTAQEAVAWIREKRGGVGAGPGVHDALVREAGVAPGTASLFMIFGALALVGPAGFGARVALDRWTSKQRRARAAAADRLLASLRR